MFDYVIYLWIAVLQIYNMFMRGDEILSGAQSIHDYKFLLEREKHHAIGWHLKLDEKMINSILLSNV